MGHPVREAEPGHTDFNRDHHSEVVVETRGIAKMIQGEPVEQD